MLLTDVLGNDALQIPTELSVIGLISKRITTHKASNKDTEEMLQT
jgi:hypothetical protein